MARRGFTQSPDVLVGASERLVVTMKAPIVLYVSWPIRNHRFSRIRKRSIHQTCSGRYTVRISGELISHRM